MKTKIMPGYQKCIGAVTLMVIMLGCCGIAAQSDQPLVNVGNEDDPTILEAFYGKDKLPDFVQDVYKDKLSMSNNFDLNNAL